MKFAKGLRDLLLTLLYAVPSLFNVGGLLFLLIFVFAVLGMQLFHQVFSVQSHLSP